MTVGAAAGEVADAVTREPMAVADLIAVEPMIEHWRS
jgi:hypothetical protein